jgi:hypothetical protein
VLGRKALAVYQYDLPAIHFQRNAYREVSHFANQGCPIDGIRVEHDDFVVIIPSQWYKREARYLLPSTTTRIASPSLLGRMQIQSMAKLPTQYRIGLPR